MGLGRSIRNIVNTGTGGLAAPLIGGSSSYRENLGSFYTGDFGRSIDESQPIGSIANPTQGQFTAANVFSRLSPEQQKDILINNPNIVTPQGKQSFDPLTNTIQIEESGFTEAQRERQEGLAAALTGSLSGDISAPDVQQAVFERGKAQLDPIFASQRKNLEQQLADQGIPRGSEQYTSALNRLEQSQGRQLVDLSQASIVTAEGARQNRFNEIASLLGTSQVQGVGFGQFQPRASGLDLFGAEQAQLNRQAQNEILSRQLRSQRSMARTQAIGGLGSAGIGALGLAFSDRNLKENIELVGKSDSGIDIYEFNYIDKSIGPRRYRGVIAQELKDARPDAVIRNKDGILMVDYGLIDVDFEEV